MYYSQDKQDQFLNESLFHNFRNGTFVDVGAHDGKSLNNTLFFQEQLGWNGINVEPIPSVYDKLVKNRPTCININCAIDETEGTAEFILNEGYTEMISGLKKHYDLRHFMRLKKEISEKGGETQTVPVNTLRLETIFDIKNILHVHYLSIDVEGAELSVIKSINFDKVFIDVIGFENNYPEASNDIVLYLNSKDYVLYARGLDIFMIHKNSQFFPRKQPNFTWIRK